MSTLAEELEDAAKLYDADAVRALLARNGPGIAHAAACAARLRQRAAWVRELDKNADPRSDFAKGWKAACEQLTGPMTTAIEPHLRPESEKAELRLGLELLALKLCQTQPYILTALKESGLTVVPLATPSPETGTAAVPTERRCMVTGHLCGTDTTLPGGCSCASCAAHRAAPAPEPVKPPVTCLCTHAPEQHHRETGCGVVSIMSGRCPCEWTGRRECAHGRRTCEACKWMAGYPAEVVVGGNPEGVRTPAAGTAPMHRCVALRGEPGERDRDACDIEQEGNVRCAPGRCAIETGGAPTCPECDRLDPSCICPPDPAAEPGKPATEGRFRCICPEKAKCPNCEWSCLYCRCSRRATPEKGGR